MVSLQMYVQNIILVIIGYYICRRQPCNFKSRIEESKEACKKFKEKITMVEDTGRGKTAWFHLYFMFGYERYQYNRKFAL